MDRQRLRLRDIPGVGERIYEKLVEYFGSEEKALEALLRGQVASVAEAVSSTRRAVRLVQQARGALGGYDPGEVVGTADAARLFEAVARLLAGYIASAPGRDLVSSLAPVPGRVEAEIERVLRRTRRLVEAASKVSGDAKAAVREALSRVEWPRRPRVHVERVVVVPRGRGDKLREILGSDVSGITIVEAESIDDVPEQGIVLAYMVDAAGRPGVVEIDRLDKYTVAPEAVLETLRQNMKLIESFARVYAVARGLVVEVSEAIGVKQATVDEIARLARDAQSVLERLEKGDIDPEYRHALTAVKSLESAVSDLEVWVNEEARRRLEERELRLSAAEFLRLIHSLEEGHLHIPDELLEIFEEISVEAEEKLAHMLGLGPEERELIRGVVEPRPQFPIEVQREPIERLREHLERRISLSVYMFSKEHARRLSRLVELLPTMAEILAWTDIALAASSFIEERRGSIAEVSRGFTGVGFTDAAEAGLLAAGVEVQPVSYVVGCTPYRPEGTNCERVVLLTGANSGGKTTLLKTIGEIVLAGQAGLPVPASRAWVGGFDRVYFISKPTGMLDAGGLEETLKKIAAIVEEAQRKRVLLLVDELEAITEAHAAARIVAAIASSIAESRDSVAVIVSHLAGEVVEAIPPELRARVRIDGIEARGLDENYNLIVDRSPRYNYLARSTPELIVAKLLRKSRRKSEREFFEKVLDLLSR